MRYEAIGSVQWEAKDLINSLEDFLQIYMCRPIQHNEGGMTSSHMFATWFLCKQLNPQYIIESGVWKGQSSWLLETACPDAKIISIDPDLQIRQYISPHIQYTTTDFNNIDWNSIDKNKTLCFFDDHYGVDRIKQAAQHGFKYILYEDNYHDGRGNSYHPLYGQVANMEPLNKGERSYSPKASFLLNTKDAQWLQNNIEIYYEFPPMYSSVDSDRGYKWAQISRQQYLDITPTPLLNTHHPRFDIYHKEASDYTWIAYIKLKGTV